ncbi:unnamed protein product [Dovyalis caffra]|uniref:Uncharacterized protein n=1 Tax=Dovyalis caffra TaxID=77055 RepID=A0AAV1RJD5_9ROSI|nr:unnamed protein product [Dovyalis caffra]
MASPQVRLKIFILLRLWEIPWNFLLIGRSTTSAAPARNYGLKVRVTMWKSNGNREREGTGEGVRVGSNLDLALPPQLS